MRKRRRIQLRPYSFSLRGDLRALVHSLDPGGVGGSGPEVALQLLDLRLQRAAARLTLHFVHVHVQLVPLLLSTLDKKKKDANAFHRRPTHKYEQCK